MADGMVRVRGQLLARLMAAVLSGFLLYASFAPLLQRWLAPLGVAVLLIAVHRASILVGMVGGLLAGAAFFGPLLIWAGVVVGAVPWLLLAVSQSVFFGALGGALAAVTRLRLWPLWAAALWVLEEALRGRLPFGGFPWGRLAFSQDDGPLLRLAALGGAPLVTFAVALVGGFLAWAALSAVRRRLLPAVGAVALAGVVVAAAAVVPRLDSATGSATVAVIQGNVPRLGLEFNAQREAVLRNHVDRTLELAAAVDRDELPQPDAVIWPENASDIDPFDNPSATALIDQAAQEIGVPILVGAMANGPGELRSNIGVVWDPASGPGERYVKRHPVPFAEYIPLRSLARLISDKVELVRRDMAAGSEPGVLDVGAVRVGDVICFEVAYDGLVRDVVRGGGELVVVQTNNATFERSAETEQQLAMSRVRAVEHGRTVLVAATSGVSAIVAPDGRVTDRAEIFTPAVLVDRVALSTEATPATRVGAIPEWVIAIIGAFALAVAIGVPSGRRRGRPPAEPDPAIRRGPGSTDRRAALADSEVSRP